MLELIWMWMNKESIASSIAEIEFGVLLSVYSRALDKPRWELSAIYRSSHVWPTTFNTVAVQDETSRLENKICTQYQMHMQWNHLYTSFFFLSAQTWKVFLNNSTHISQIWILNQQKTFYTAELLICCILLKIILDSAIGMLL